MVWLIVVEIESKGVVLVLRTHIEPKATLIILWTVSPLLIHYIFNF